MAFRVKAEAVVLKVGSSEMYSYKGQIVPDSATNTAWLADAGLLEEIDLPQPVHVVEESRDETPVKAVESVGPVVVPPKAGPGSSAEAWRKYATDNGVQVDAGVDRAGVIAALENAGIATE